MEIWKNHQKYHYQNGKYQSHRLGLGGPLKYQEIMIQLYYFPFMSKKVTEVISV